MPKAVEHGSQQAAERLKALNERLEGASIPRKPRVWDENQHARIREPYIPRLTVTEQPADPRGGTAEGPRVSIDRTLPSYKPFDTRIAPNVVNREHYGSRRRPN